MNQQQTYYYEIIHGEVYLLIAGSIQSFRTVEQMHQYVSDPSALFIDVTDPVTWKHYYDAGEFDQ